MERDDSRWSSKLSSLNPFKSRHQRAKSHSPVPEEDPAHLTDQERLSRMLHGAKGNMKAPEGMLYEYFLVVGLRQKKIYTDAVNEPELLFKHPPDAPLLPKIIDFCFPDGVKTRRLQKTNSFSSLYSLVCSPTQFTHSSNSFIFMLTTDTKDVLYGICVKKEESLEHYPSFIPEEDGEESHISPAIPSRKMQFVVAPRVYCLVSRYPFFPLHFDILYGVFGIFNLNST
eukprot:TRINITY_DN1721_c0_g3_i5.p1 TRINITY_DN1721_c0_g3~~TRINITY_DN1721_c0_g3_i5.p1  ORF type:complete len:228 (-),score=25.37 TRINITY_DN1721_c0_g3_i5:76-759(-)